MAYPCSLLTPTPVSQVVKLLLARGAKPRTRTKQRKSALDFARDETVRFLLKRKMGMLKEEKKNNNGASNPGDAAAGEASSSGADAGAGAGAGAGATNGAAATGNSDATDTGGSSNGAAVAPVTSGAQGGDTGSAPPAQAATTNDTPSDGCNDKRKRVDDGVLIGPAGPPPPTAKSADVAQGTAAGDAVAGSTVQERPAKRQRGAMEDAQ